MPMPQLLCLWNLSRQFQRELIDICVPELEVALTVLQTTTSEIKPWISIQNPEANAVPTDRPHSQPSPEVPLDSLPASLGDHADSSEAHSSADQPQTHASRSDGKSACLLRWVQFVDDGVARKALQRCSLLTAIIEVQRSARVPVHLKRPALLLHQLSSEY